jgi:tetratricopeptide (TPR) repeat protein
LPVKRLLSTCYFEFPLLSRGKTVVFIIAVIMPGLLLAFRAVVIAVAATMGNSSESREVRQAVALDPANPQLHYRLGRVDGYSMDPSEVQDGLKQLRQATILAPTQPEYWSGLASACESVGDTTCADRALQRTLALAPATPRYRWNAANDELARGRADEALREFQKLLEMDPGYAPETIRLCLKYVGDPGKVFRSVLANREDPQLNFSFINYLVAHGQGAEAYPAWQATVALNKAFPVVLAGPYLEWLIRQGRDQEAVSAWRDLQSHGIIRKPPAGSEGNLVFNGGFEGPLLKMGFGWRVHKEPYTRVVLDGSGPYAGDRSARVDFTVSRNDNDEPLSEIVPVTPGHSYRLQAFVRSDDISSNSGPRLRVTDPKCSRCLDVSTDGTVGTTNWHPVTVNFSTGPSTRQVQISICRFRSLAFPTEISGRFWVDAVDLKDDTPSKEQALQASAPSL